MSEIDKQTIDVWRMRYPCDNHMTDDEILSVFGKSLTFSVMRLGCAKDNFVEAIMETWLFRLFK